MPKALFSMCVHANIYVVLYNIVCIYINMNNIYRQLPLSIFIPVWHQHKMLFLSGTTWRYDGLSPDTQTVNSTETLTHTHTHTQEGTIHISYKALVGSDDELEDILCTEREI